MTNMFFIQSRRNKINFAQFIRFFTVDPVSLSFTGKLISIIVCFASVFIVALVTRQFLATATGFPIIVASMGASAVILFIIPNSPLAQPWPFIGGQLCSAVVGISSALYCADAATAAGVAVGGSVLLMLLLRCLHPPGAATALAPVMSGEPITSLGYSFVLAPVGINALIMLVIAVIINRWVLRRQYPLIPQPKDTTPDQQQSDSRAVHRIGISEQDLQKAIVQLDNFVDITNAELGNLLNLAEMHSFQRIKGNITCADIMIKNVPIVEYGTEVENAWQTMRDHKVKAIPVIDVGQHVIGIITWHDFFKFIDMSVYAGFQQKFKSFIRRTAGISTNKPEAVGHIMSSDVVVLTQDTHISELIPLMTAKEGHRQIPIVDKKRRLVGMVYQQHLIAALYNGTLAEFFQ